MLLRILSITVFILIGGCGALADDTFFPYTLPWNDTSANLTNLSGWNEKPAGKHGFVTVRDGHLYEGDKRLRLIGASIVFGATMPTHEDADQIAARMARFGFNIVRFHHMDSQASPNGLLEKDKLTFDPAQLDKLDYFIAALKRNGIYADLNLHVMRTYPGFTQWQDTKGNPQPKGWKGVDNFFIPMITMQQDYARTLLTHKNPYTGNRYVDEPAVALIEINNENGLMFEWFGGGLDPMTDPMLSDFRNRWNAWLKQHYGSTSALSKAWGLYATPMGSEMFTTSRANAGWTLQAVKPAQAGLTSDGSGTVVLSVSQVDGTDWHVQLHQNGLSFKAHQLYTIEVNMHADHPAKISFAAMQNHAPWQNVWRTTVNVGTSWQKYSFAFIPAVDEPSARFTISSMGAQTGTFFLAGSSLKPGGNFGPQGGGNDGGWHP